MAVAALVAATSLAGAGLGFYGQQKQAKAQKKAERLRQRQMDLEASRRRRSIIREATIARANALSGATAGNAQYGSGLQGGYGQINNQATQNIQATNQSQEIGAGIFAANRQYAEGAQIANLGQGISSLGGGLGNFISTFPRV